MPLKITLHCHSHLENLVFHFGHSSPVKAEDMQNNGDTSASQPHHAGCTRTRRSNLLQTEALRHDGNKGQGKNNKNRSGTTRF